MVNDRRSTLAIDPNEESQQMFYGEIAKTISESFSNIHPIWGSYQCLFLFVAEHSTVYIHIMRKLGFGHDVELHIPRSVHALSLVSALPVYKNNYYTLQIFIPPANEV